MTTASRHSCAMRSKSKGRTHLHQVESIHIHCDVDCRNMEDGTSSNQKTKGHHCQKQVHHVPFPDYGHIDAANSSHSCVFLSTQLVGAYRKIRSSSFPSGTIAHVAGNSFATTCIPFLGEPSIVKYFPDFTLLISHPPPSLDNAH